MTKWLNEYREKQPDWKALFRVITWTGYLNEDILLRQKNEVDSSSRKFFALSFAVLRCEWVEFKLISWWCAVNQFLVIDHVICMMRCQSISCHWSRDLADALSNNFLSLITWFVWCAVNQFLVIDHVICMMCCQSISCHSSRDLYDALSINFLSFITWFVWCTVNQFLVIDHIIWLMHCQPISCHWSRDLADVLPINLSFITLFGRCTVNQFLVIDHIIWLMGCQPISCHWSHYLADALSTNFLSLITWFVWCAVNQFLVIDHVICMMRYQSISCQWSRYLADALSTNFLSLTVADPGSQMGRERYLPSWWHQPIIWPNFSRKQYENERIWTQRGGGEICQVCWRPSPSPMLMPPLGNSESATVLCTSSLPTPSRPPFMCSTDTQVGFN